MESDRSDILILGVGNDILMDDGIGPVIIRDLKSEYDGSNIDFESINLGGLEVFEFIKEYRRVVIIDAIKTRDGIPGDVYYMTPSDFIETCHLTSFHDISFLTAMKLGEKIGYKMPDVGIVAVEIVEDMQFGTTFSPDIEARYGEIYAEIKEFLLPVITGVRSNRIINNALCV